MTNQSNETGISHLSYSAVRDFLTNPRLFRKRWIDGDWSRTPQLALVEGSAFHAGLEIYWGQIFAGLLEDKSTFKRGIVIDMAEIGNAVAVVTEKEYPPTTKPENRIKRRIAKKDVAEYEAQGCEIEEKPTLTATGKPTSIMYAILTPAMIAKNVLESVEAFIAERNEEHYIPKAIEQKHVAQTVDVEKGTEHVFPLKIRTDLLAESEGELVFIDWKYMSTDPEEGDDGEATVSPSMKMQGACYVSAAPSLLKELGIEGEVKTVIFDIFNKKSGKMTRVRYTPTELDMRAWSRLFRGVGSKVTKAYNSEDFDDEFLPNLDDWSSDGWDEFMRDVELSQSGEERAPAAEQKEEYAAYEL